MPGKFSWIKEEFLIDGAWEGIHLEGMLRQIQAGIGAGSSCLADAFWATLGARSVKLLPIVTGQAQAMRATVEFDTGIWTITHDLQSREVTFLAPATGEVDTFPVVPEAGERSAGSYTLELMGIPEVETARGSVTIDSVMTLLYLQQVYAGQMVYGGANLQDLAVTIEVCFGLLDEQAAKLKAQSTAAKRRATTAATKLKTAREQRLADGLPTSVDLDAEEARLAKALDAANAEAARLDGELEARLAVLAARVGEAARALQSATDAGLAADRAQQALAPHYQARGQARAVLAQAEQDAKPRTHCPDCEQPLQQRNGPGPTCGLCRQSDPGQAGRLTRRMQKEAAARSALAAVEQALTAAQTNAQHTVDARRTAGDNAQQAAARSDTYRAAEITPREQGKSRAEAAAAGYRAATAAVRERRKELTRITELDRAFQRAEHDAQDAREAWTAAEGDAQHVREQMAKELSVIFAEKVIPMAPDKIRHASIDPRTFAPKLNGRTIKQVARSAGLVNIANAGLHLTFFEASRTLPGVLLPTAQWLDAPLDGLGGGAEGERLITQTLQVITTTAADEAQIVLATAQELPPSPSIVSTVHDSHRLVIPHARSEADDSL
ncbi:hypothetical protein [Streptomyces sp. NBC_00859]|uniref:hypothetical protein n=1 Tax=Streptomyces sp. NBC_00859 TaxID=2903682 RepID=UPI003863F4A6|nr:hypothetical protein OG584_00180 [Streptomyces sp. NBC_00859]WSZ86761.1 hypothetical protein OG584_34960 [Streptomyces sp. NBC_00859]